MTHDDNNIKDIYSLDDELLDALDGMKDTQEPATELPDDDRTDARLTDLLALAAAADCSRRNDDVEQRLQKMLTHYAGKGQCGDAQTDGERQKNGDNGGGLCRAADSDDNVAGEQRGGDGGDTAARALQHCTARGGRDGESGRRREDSGGGDGR